MKKFNLISASKITQEGIDLAGLESLAVAAFGTTKDEIISTIENDGFCLVYIAMARWQGVVWECK